MSNDRSKLVYLDHNILDSMIKGDPFKVKEFLVDPIYSPVFSDTNLDEISRSKGAEEKFLNVLREIKARHIKTVLDAPFIPTRQAEVREIDPAHAFTSYVETRRTAMGGNKAKWMLES